jgi:histidinol-phosphate aminotransferase
MVVALREQGWDVPETQANFVWLNLGDDALDFAAACEPLSVRAFAGDGVRISIGTPEVNAEFLDRAATWRKEH